MMATMAMMLMFLPFYQHFCCDHDYLFKTYLLQRPISDVVTKKAYDISVSVNDDCDQDVMKMADTYFASR